MFGSRMVVNVWVLYPRGHMAELGLPTPAQYHKSIILHITSPRKGQNSKIEVRFLLTTYDLCTIIKSKNHRVNH